MAITLAILGVPYFLPLGSMVVLGIVPFIGSAIGAVIIGDVRVAGLEGGAHLRGRLHRL
jgi:hypothetical protein